MSEPEHEQIRPDLATVAELYARYAAAIDDAEFEVLADVFTEDASFTVAITDGPTVGPHESSGEIIDFISTTTRTQPDQRRHVITNMRLADESTAYALLALFATAEGQLTVQTTGAYRTELAREDGCWRFCSMYLTLDRPY